MHADALLAVRRVCLGRTRPPADLLQRHRTREAHRGGAERDLLVEPRTGIDPHQAIHLDQLLPPLGGMGRHHSRHRGPLAGDRDGVPDLQAEQRDILGIEPDQTAPDIA